MTNILVVEDSHVDRVLIGGLLDRHPDLHVTFAENGLEAIHLLENLRPDIIVTDLVMPELDGLDLVTRVRDVHPHIPIILVTSRGNEGLAVEALQRGAASYIPKSQLAMKLVGTVDRVLTLSQAQSSLDRLAQCITGAEFNFCLENDPELIDPLTTLVQQMILSLQACEAPTQMQLGIALSEAVHNAMLHGNLGIHVRDPAIEGLSDAELNELIRQRRDEAPYDRRRVRVHVSITPAEVRFRIGDEGEGFDVSVLPRANDPAALDPMHGRGVSLMRSFVDEVTYNAAGNEVTLIKRCG